MARARRLPHVALDARAVDARLAAQPRRFGFFQAVRLIEARAGRPNRTGRRGSSLVGEEAEPQQRAVIFRAAAHLSYPESEIHGLDLLSDPPQMDVNLIGLTGPVGVLPQHYSVVLANELRHRNLALRDFFDLFNHRLIAFFYRAWVKYRVPISVERDGTRGNDGATQMLRALVGFATDRLAERSRIGQHSLLHYAGLLGHLPRNAASLQQLLIDYFGLPVRIEQFRARWLPLPPEQRSRVGLRGRFAGLGVDAALGESFCDMQGNFAILIGPIGYGEFLQFMPESAKLDELAALTRLYVDPQLGFRVELVLARREIPRLHLAVAAPPRLGWNTWLRHYPAAEDARDAGWYL
ncbi:MAG TPA: type VI secretion system baseplate subunit TssG [Stellaceae bacterium]|nr:type VI secretion system baseplate subunit TssG [Stellaceae bacterium]